MVRRLALIGLTLSLLLGLSETSRLFSQDAKKEEPKAEAKKDEPKTEAKKEEPKKDEPKKDEPPPPIPPEVEAKLAAARKAVAEAIVAAQDAGLVKTSIEPPPILDILITGRANDEASVKAKTGVSPEVFGAWFTGYGKAALGVTPQTDVRIIYPSAGLKAWYDQRAEILNREIEAVRKAKGTPAPKAETKKEEPKAEPKKEEPKAEPKKEEPKAEPKKEEPKAEPKKEEPKAEPKKEEPKAEPKKEEPKKEEKK